MLHYIVSVEKQGKRQNTVEVPVSVEPVVRDGVDCSAMVAAEKAERVAAESFGGRLVDWFAWKVEPDNE